ncbi:hydantoinase/oxoprolinase family protein [Spirosoma taeanense]|uniref:Hydantoinase/oxoprolinase family protein n=1 Tax=Spirosoma taeanense TaxID=2735870 RepID=A0A6M5YCI0_9BACT|nr:hydantoinase/oxoprolinase family protein [Spirosoma taeanense]QJW90622.1 hydantoinase/oxoprolinase family protein [Spirosoma taeanense]
MRYKLGIDIGGTFTDLVLLNETTGELTFGKTLTTYDTPTDGIINGIDELLARVDLTPADIGTVVHGTTLLTNAVTERKGALTGLITTRGFEDVLEIGREYRYDIYDLQITMPEPLVPRNLRLGVTERVDFRGSVLTPLLDTDAIQAIDELVGQGCQAIAVCLLHSFMNPVHERALDDLIRQRHPAVYVSLSVDVMPEVREYERMSATVMNAYIQPLTDQYLSDLRDRLQTLGFAGSLQIMISSGRLTTLNGARKSPIQLLESGPAGGSMAGVFFGKLAGHTDIATFDMGGTTAKASLIINRTPQITNQFETARVRRFRKGSGLPVRIPVIDMIEIGAGGGGIAYVDGLGLLKVGPESAASEPGPACYGRGGIRPTVTDCDLVLGYLNENFFLGGTLKLDKEAARRAIDEHIAQPLNISVLEAAMGVHRIVNENMANATRVHILEKGHDPRQYTLLAFGGAGPVHAFEVARLLGLPEVMIPVGAGVTSALGFLVSPTASECVRSYISPVAELDWNRLNDLLAEMEEEGFLFLEQAGHKSNEATVSRVADMRYAGQGHEITVRIPNGVLSALSIAEIEQSFRKEYQLCFGRLIDDAVIESVTWRVAVSSPPVLFNPKQADVNKKYSIGDKDFSGLKGYRQVYFMGDSVPSSCPVYDRYQIRPNDCLSGPVLIEERESTVVVGHKAYVRMDEHRNLVISLRR